MHKKYSLRQDPIDLRDRVYKASYTTTLGARPASVDLRYQLSPIVDQGYLGSCTSNAIGSGFREHQLIKDGLPLTRLSRLFHYYEERVIEGSVNTDAGAYLRDGMKVLQQTGICPEVLWPYNEAKFAVKPPDEAYARAAEFKIAEYHRVLTFDDLLDALAAGQSVVLGISIYNSFESSVVSNTGMVQVPDTTKESFLGGHAVLACGYMKFSDGVLRVLVRNSWGENWGQGGYCWIPADFFLKGFCTDMWTGTAEINPDKMTFAEALKVLVDKQIFNSPEFWLNFEKNLNLAN